MTLQQLEYLVALDNHRHFVKAAEACGVTQATLSLMIKNLENELDITIFDRSTHPVEPTPAGMKILSQARITLYHAQQLHELARVEKNVEEGEIRLGIIPTISPYLLPQLFVQMKMTPKVSLRVEERQTSAILAKIKRAELDMAILATPLADDELMEIPLYYEKFLAYVSPNDPLYHENCIHAEKLTEGYLWMLQEGHCFRSQVLNLCGQMATGKGTKGKSPEENQPASSIYAAGSIDTLIRIVDINGGHTIIPELHLDFLTQEQKQNVRPILPADAVREVSLVIRNDYVKEGLLNVVGNAIKRIVPEQMLDTRLKKYSIRI